MDTLQIVAYALAVAAAIYGALQARRGTGRPQLVVFVVLALIALGLFLGAVDGFDVDVTAGEAD